MELTIADFQKCGNPKLIKYVNNAMWKCIKENGARNAYCRYLTQLIGCEILEAGSCLGELKPHFYALALQVLESVIISSSYTTLL